MPLCLDHGADVRAQGSALADVPDFMGALGFFEPDAGRRLGYLACASLAVQIALSCGVRAAGTVAVAALCASL